jgi:molybdopterin molybdotransferase
MRPVHDERGGMSLLSVTEAQAWLLALAEPLPPEMVPLANARGRWTTTDIEALRSQPACDLSAMDGYAVRFIDIPGPFGVIGTSAAGAAFEGVVNLGEAVRIYTGAVLPLGADTVILQEDVLRENAHITMLGEASSQAGSHIRAVGSDFGEQHTIIPTGTKLSARHIALAALAGHAILPLPRLPRIAIVSSGSELVPPGACTHSDQIPSSNAFMLQAMLSELPCEVKDVGIVPDDLATLSGVFSDLRDCDVIVSTGGASVGDHDLVKPAIEQAGGAIDFWKIAMRPGKPLISGKIGDAVFLGLPGNPVSAFVTATVFLLPLIRQLAGCPAPLPIFQTAALASPMPAVGPREDYARGITADGRVTPLSVQDSAATLGLSLANCLIRRSAGSNAAFAGEKVTILHI